MTSARLELLDIFSYSCMNCLRSLNYIKKLDKKYKKHGLRAAIVHVPEWKFEKNMKNISKAIKGHNIKFPKIIDKNKKLLKKLGINFWPSQILIKDGRVLYTHIGEGDYKELENNIKRALKLKTNPLFLKEPKYSKYPAIYAGRRKKGVILGLNAKKIDFGAIYAGKGWLQKSEYIESIADNSEIKIKLAGNISNITAQSLTKKPVKIRLKTNDKKIESQMISNPNLYQLLKSKTKNKKVLEIIADKGLAIYSFSFQ